MNCITNIYYVGGNMSSDIAGGAVVSLKNLVDKFSSNRSYRLVTVASGVNGPDTLSFGAISHISFNPLLSISLRNIISNIKSTISLLIYFLKNTYGLRKTAKAQDVIINNGHWCLDSDILVVRFCHKSYIRSLEYNNKLGNLLCKILDLKSHVILQLEALILHSKRLKFVVVLSEESKADLIKSYSIIKDKIVVIPNGVDTDKFIFSQELRDSVRKELNVTSRSTVILYSGHNTFRKNLEGAIKVFMKLHTSTDIHLLVLSGETSDASLYKKYAHTKNVHFIGWTEKPEIYYHASDIFLFPTFYDTGTKAVLEAVVNGLYVVTSENSGVAEFIPPSKGTVINGVFNCEKYVEKIDKLLSNNIIKERDKLISSSIQTWDSIASEYYKIIERVLCLKGKK